jgi:hypothetical protein
VHDQFGRQRRRRWRDGQCDAGFSRRQSDRAHVSLSSAAPCQYLAVGLG